MIGPKNMSQTLMKFALNELKSEIKIKTETYLFKLHKSINCNTDESQQTLLWNKLDQIFNTIDTKT